MPIVVDGTPAEILDRIEGFFALEWAGEPGSIKRTNNSVKFIAHKSEESTWGCLVHLILTVLTLGLWIIVWLMVDVGRFLGNAARKSVTVAVKPIEDSPGWVEITTDSGIMSEPSDWETRVNAWLRREFVYSRG